jgi:hypothetical protein
MASVHREALALVLRKQIGRIPNHMSRDLRQGWHRLRKIQSALMRPRCLAPGKCLMFQR